MLCETLPAGIFAYHEIGMLVVDTYLTNLEQVNAGFVRRRLDPHSQAFLLVKFWV